MALAMAGLHASLKLAGLRRTQSLVERLGTRRGHRLVAGKARARRLAALSEAAVGLGWPGRSCLRQSLLLYWLLRRAGLQPALRLGAARTQGGLSAHAWVELDGEALLPARGHVAFGDRSRA